MKKSKDKICKVPGCKKEVYSAKSLFCGQHERSAKSVSGKALKTAAATIITVGAYVGKKIIDK